MARRHELSDNEGAQLEPLLLAKQIRGRPPMITGSSSMDLFRLHARTQ